MSALNENIRRSLLSQIKLKANEDESTHTPVSEITETNNNSDQGRHPQDRPDYSNIDYWEDRYSSDNTSGTFEWVVTYSNPVLRSLLDTFITSVYTSFLRPVKFLHPGCGDSTLGVDIMSSSTLSAPISLDNTDASPAVVSKMASLHPSSTWFVADVLSPCSTESRGSYDAVIDKCLCDAFLCGGVESDKLDKVKSYLWHCSEVTNDRGRLIMISFGQPESRMRFFKQEGVGWSENVTVEEVIIPMEDGRKNKCWVYEFTK